LLYNKRVREQHQRITTTKQKQGKLFYICFMVSKSYIVNETNNNTQITFNMFLFMQYIGS